MNISEIYFNYLVDLFTEKNYLMLMGAGKLSKKFNTTKDMIYKVKEVVKTNLAISEELSNIQVEQKSNIFAGVPKSKPVKKSKNVLIIGDTHIPYEHPDYLDFCKEQYDKYNCDTVVHIGDLIDSHATSRHPSVPDAYSPGDELYYTIRKLRAWYKVFPEMNVCIGNHDIRAYRIAAESRLASKWLRGFADVLEVPNWKFEESFEINDIFYTHGTGTSGINAAKTRALNLGQSVVIGHLHTDASILYHTLRDRTIFGMIVGCGVDENSYGMNYAKNAPKRSVLSCGVVLDGQPLLITM